MHIKISLTVLLFTLILLVNTHTFNKIANASCYRYTSLSLISTDICTSTSQCATNLYWQYWRCCYSSLSGYYDCSTPTITAPTVVGNGVSYTCAWNNCHGITTCFASYVSNPTAGSDTTHRFNVELGEPTCVEI